jgi:H+/Cl- antiporter ClcA
LVILELIMSTEEGVETEMEKDQEKESESEVPRAQNEGDHEEKDDNKAMLDLLGPAYARNTQYWRILIFSGAFQGILLGIIALAFFNLYTALAQATWKRGKYQEALSYNGGEDDDPAILDVLKLGNGQWWYVGMTTGAGLAVGALKVTWSALFPNHVFPHRTPGFLEDLQKLKSDDVWLALPVLAASGLSIGLGANVGPEAAMGGAGASVGTFIARRWRIGPFQAKKCGDNESEGGLLSNILPDFSNDCDLCSMDGMAAAFGALFPSQFLAPMLMHELGGSRGKYAVTWTLARTGVAATFAYGLFTGLEDLARYRLSISPGGSTKGSGVRRSFGNYLRDCWLSGFFQSCTLHSHWQQNLG